MKILILTSTTSPDSGWGRYAAELIRGVRELGNKVSVLVEDSKSSDGVPCIKKGLGIFSSAFAVRKYIKTHHPDVVHALDINPYGIIAWLATRGLRVRLIITAQGTYSIAPLYGFKTAFLSKIAYHSSDLVIAISRFTAAELKKKVSPRRLEIINHGIDLEKFLLPRKQSDERFILSTGALKFRKGYHIAMRAFARVSDEFPNLRYKIVGSQKDNEYVAQLKKIATEEKITDRVDFLENVSDSHLRTLYQGAEMFLLPSINQGHHFEGFGLVFLEAAAAGLPVVGTKDNGIEDAVLDGRNGILVPQEDADKTSGALRKILSNKELQEKMRHESYAWAKEHSWKSIAVKYDTLYKQYG